MNNKNFYFTLDEINKYKCSEILLVRIPFREKMINSEIKKIPCIVETNSEKEIIVRSVEKRWIRKYKEDTMILRPKYSYGFCKTKVGRSVNHFVRDHPAMWIDQDERFIVFKKRISKFYWIEKRDEKNRFDITNN